MASYPPWNRVAAHSEKKEYYERMRAEINSAKESSKIARQTARAYRTRADVVEKEKKIVDKKLLHITEQQKSKDEAVKAGAWSGAAAIATTILYLLWNQVGYPYNAKNFWTHEAVHGTLLWFSTCCFAWLYKAFHDP
tara:strand:- start:809 stop:1219 length:411 start_codon:yes stop_codon:yes gene_type:complete